MSWSSRSSLTADSSSCVEQVGKLGSGTPNDDEFTYSYTWTLEDTVLPGRYSGTVQNDGNLTKTYSFTVRALKVSSSIEDSKLVVTVSKVRPSPPVITVSLTPDLGQEPEVNVLGTRSAASHNADGLTNSYTWTSKENVRPGRHGITVNNGKNLELKPFHDVLALLTLKTDFGIYGEGTKLLCTFSYNSVTDNGVKWFFDEEEIVGGNDYVLDSGGDTFTLTIKNMKHSNLGDYMCKYGTQTATYTLNDDVMQATLGMANTHGILGGETKLLCTMKAGSVGDGVIQWKKDGNTITDNDKYDMTIVDEDSSMLTITKTVKDDLAEYSCVSVDQTASYTLSNTDVEALVIEEDTDKDHKLVITMSEVKPGKPTVVVILDGLQTEIEGVLSEATPNADPFTDSYTWTSTHKAVPGSYRYTVGNGGHMSSGEKPYSIRAILTLVGTYGILDGETTLECMLEYGTVGESVTVEWEGGLTNEDHDISSAQGDTFTLTITDTQPRHIVEHSCTYGGQMAKYRLTNDKIQALQWEPIVDEGTFKVVIYKIRPDNPTVVVTSSAGSITGSLHDRVDNDDGLTTSYIWSPNVDTFPGTYECSVDNGQNLSEKRPFDLPATLTLVGSHGALLGKTTLMCTLRTGSVNDGTQVVWERAGVPLNDGEMYTILPAEGDTFTLTIKNTQPADLKEYTCKYDSQSATYSLMNTVIQALEVSDSVSVDNVLTITVHKVKPYPPTVQVMINNQPQAGTLSNGALNGDGFTYFYTWTLEEKVVPATYSYKVTNGEDLSVTDQVVIPASLTLFGSYGLFGKETTLRGTFEAGTVSDNSVTWSTPFLNNLSGDGNFEVSEADGEEFTLKIKNTQPSDLLEYTCEYRQQKATYALTHTVMQALLWDITHSGSTLIITLSSVKPSPGTVKVKIQGENVMGTLSDPTINNDGFTKSQTWTSSANAKPGTYDCNVTNGNALTEIRSYTVPATLKLNGTHGVLGGKTRLICTVEYGTVTTNGGSVKWLKNGAEIQNGGDYEMLGPYGEQFILIILDTQPTHFVDYTCRYKEQTSKYTLMHTVIQALLLSTEVNATSLSITIHKIKPPSPILFVKLDNMNVSGDISNGVLNEDGFTHSYTWVSSGNLFPGTYDYTASNGQDLTETGTVNIPECDVTHYGIDCENECECNMENTVDCDSVDGSCTCKTGWDGRLCQSDVNEYESNQITIKLKISIDLAIDDKKLDAKSKLENIFTDFYSSRVTGFREVIIHAIRPGSVYVVHTVVKSNTETARSDLSTALRDLFDGTSQLYYDGELAVVEEVTLTTNDGVNTQTVQLAPEVDLCSVFTSLKSCDEGYECYVSEVGARCRLKSQNDNTDLIIGLSVGIPLLLIALFLAVLCASYQKRLNRRREHVRNTPHYEPRAEGVKTIPVKLDADENSNGSFGVEDYPFGNTAHYGDMRRVTHWPSRDRVFNPHNNFRIQRPRLYKDEGSTHFYFIFHENLLAWQISVLPNQGDKGEDKFSCDGEIVFIARVSFHNHRETHTGV
ncbi:hypothetical protein ScPMuIL_003364 [Solemya velum]